MSDAVELGGDHRWQGRDEQLLRGREWDLGCLVRRRERRLEDADDRERHALEHDCVADVLVELPGDVGSEDGHVRALVRGCPGPTLGIVELERLEPLVGARHAARDHRWHAHRRRHSPDRPSAS